MRKIKTINRKHKIQSNNELYKSIMESVIPEIKKAILEAEDEDIEKNDNEDDDIITDNIEEKQLNELFGFGSSVKKPEKALSLENTDEENAELCIQWCAYFMSEAGNNVKKGLDSFFKECSEVLVKSPKLMVKGFLMLLSGGIKSTAYGITTVSAITLASISALIRLINSGVENSKESLVSLYDTLLKGLTSFYKWFNEKATDLVNTSKDKVQLWIGVAAGALMAVSNKLVGAQEKLSNWFTQVFKDAKEKKDGAVLMVKTWLSAKSTEVKEWINSTAKNIKTDVVEAWNSMNKSARKAYNNMASKLEDWMSSIKELIELTGEKISQAAKATKDFAINKKDKALIWGIQKGVKGLSKNYTEDQVVALVRKCYNESLVPDIYGNYRINEAYFYKTGTSKRIIYENRKAKIKKILR